MTTYKVFSRRQLKSGRWTGWALESTFTSLKAAKEYAENVAHTPGGDWEAKVIVP